MTHSPSGERERPDLEERHKGSAGCSLPVSATLGTFLDTVNASNALSGSNLGHVQVRGCSQWGATLGVARFSSQPLLPLKVLLSPAL